MFFNLNNKWTPDKASEIKEATGGTSKDATKKVKETQQTDEITPPVSSHHLKTLTSLGINRV